MILNKLIRDVPDFPKPGIMFKDICPLLASPVDFQDVINQLAHRYQPSRGYESPTAIAALESRGFLFGVPLALALDLPFVPIRKRGKLPGATLQMEYALEYGTDCVEIQAGVIRRGDNVLLVDDLLATGGTATAAAYLIEKAGGIVLECAFIIELLELNGAKKLFDAGEYKTFSLCKF